MNSTRGKVACFVLLCIVASTAVNARSTKGWSALAGADIWSVAWSPRGDQIAFVSAKSDDPLGEGIYVSSADIWLLRTPVRGKNTIALRHLVKRKMAQGIPVGLFWLSGDKVGWVASGTLPTGCSLGVIRVSSGTMYPLADRRFPFRQTIDSGVEGYNGPEDVYYDPRAHALFFGGLYGRKHSVAVGKYSISARTFEIQLVNSGIEDGLSLSSLVDGGTTRLFLAGLSREGKTILWQSRARDAMNKEQIIHSGYQFWFPRVSPDGKLLAWVEYIAYGKRRGMALVLYDLRSKSRKTVARFPIATTASLGCPYSWSPDGRRIAYSEGSKIGIVRVSNRGTPGRQ